MVLVTGANGQTGRAVIKALLEKGEQIRAFVHKKEQIQEMEALGVSQVIAGDMMDESALKEAFKGINSAYHICSAINSNEVEIGKRMIDIAKTSGVKHFVYHSVLHSVLQDMPHHQKKLMVEELLVNSGLPYTIIQPAVLMQNLLQSWKSLSEKGVFEQKFFRNSETRICMVDLQDVAEAVSKILIEQGHKGASYELCGPENLSLPDVLSAMKQHFGREIKVQTIPDEVFAAQLRKHGAGDYQVNTLLKMFKHYNEHGFAGNSNVLSWLLGRKPKDFSSFILRTMQSESR